MVAQPGKKSQAASRARITRDALVRRSPALSIGAKLLWAELSRGWCWTEDQVCFPHQIVLAEALGVGRRSIKRWIKELCDASLMTRRRTARGNVYVLAMTVPEKLCDPRRINNKWMAEQVRHQADGDVGPWDDITPDNPEAKLAPGPACDVQTEGPDRPPPGAKLAPDPRARGQIGPCQGPNWPLDEEAVEEKQQKEEEKQNKGSREAERTPTSSSSASDPVHFSAREEHQGASSITICSLGVVTPAAAPKDDMEDLDELLEEDDAPRRKPGNKKARRGRRANSLVDLPGDGLRTASKLPGGPGSVKAGPPPPFKAKDVLELLRGEIEERFGPKAARGIPEDLSAKEKGQIRNAILRKYSPDVVLAMIRVLVWDWEIARVTFFPFRPDRSIPLVENLVQYSKDLAASITTGLTYAGDMRGSVNTYADVYLKGKEIVNDDDPF